MGLFLSSLFTQEFRPVRTLNLYTISVWHGPHWQAAVLVWIWPIWVFIECVVARSGVRSLPALHWGLLLGPFLSERATNLLVEATVIYHIDSGNAPFYSNMKLMLVTCGFRWFILYVASSLPPIQVGPHHPSADPVLLAACGRPHSDQFTYTQRICSFLLEQSCWSLDYPLSSCGTATCIDKGTELSYQCWSDHPSSARPVAALSSVRAFEDTDLTPVSPFTPSPWVCHDGSCTCTPYFRIVR